MPNLMTLRRLTRSRIGVPVSDDFFGDPVLDDHINLAIQAIEGEYHWPWSDVIESVTVTPDEPDIPQPADYRATRTIFDGDTELSLIAPGDLLAWTQITGQLPRVWTPMAGTIVIRPTTPDTRELTHYWYRSPAWLANDEDRPAIPEQFLGAIVAKAAELLSSREGVVADAGRHGAEYSEWVGRMRRDVRRTTTPTRVRVRPGGWI